jgi:hypothetical protein
MNRDTGFRILAVALALVTAFHAAAVVAPGLGIPGTRLRHALWVPIAAIGTVLVLRRPRWLVFPFAAVTVFGVYGHLDRLTERWPALDWIAALDLLAIIGLPVALWMLMLDRRKSG